MKTLAEAVAILWAQSGCEMTYGPVGVAHSGTSPAEEHPSAEPEAKTTAAAATKRTIRLEQGIRLQALAQRLGIKATEVLLKCLSMGLANVHINTDLDADVAAAVAREFGWDVEPNVEPEAKVSACKRCGDTGKILGDCGDSPNVWFDPCPDCLVDRAVAENMPKATAKKRVLEPKPSAAAPESSPLSSGRRLDQIERLLSDTASRATDDLIDGVARSMASFIAEIDSSSERVAAYIVQRLGSALRRMTRPELDRIAKDGRKLDRTAQASVPESTAQAPERVRVWRHPASAPWACCESWSDLPTAMPPTVYVRADVHDRALAEMRERAERAERERDESYARGNAPAATYRRRAEEAEAKLEALESSYAGLHSQFERVAESIETRIAAALDTVANPGSTPVGAPGSVMRRAWEMGREAVRRMADLEDQVARRLTGELKTKLAAAERERDELTVEVVANAEVERDLRKECDELKAKLAESFAQRVDLLARAELAEKQARSLTGALEYEVALRTAASGHAADALAKLATAEAREHELSDILHGNEHETLVHAAAFVQERRAAAEREAREQSAAAQYARGLLRDATDEVARLRGTVDAVRKANEDAVTLLDEALGEQTNVDGNGSPTASEALYETRRWIRKAMRSLDPVVDPPQEKPAKDGGA